MALLIIVAIIAVLAIAFELKRGAPRRWSDEEIRDWRFASNTPALDNSDLNAALDKAKAAASDSPGYQQALLDGFVGTPDEWVMALVGVRQEEAPVVYLDYGQQVMNWTVCELLMMASKEQIDEAPRLD